MLEAKVEGEASGTVDRVPSRAAALAALAAVGAAGGRVRASRGLVDVFHRFYARLGYPASGAGEVLAVEPEPPSRPVVARVHAPCDVLAVSVMAAVAAVAAPLGSQVAIGVDCPWMVEHDFRYLIEGVAQLGARIWRTDTPQSLLIVEPTAAVRSAYRELVRLAGVVPGYVLAALMAAAAWLPKRVYIVVTGEVRGPARVSLFADVLRSLGVEVEPLPDGRGVAVGSPQRPVDYTVPSGYAEALVVSVMAARGKVRVEGLPRSLGDEHGLLAVHKALGVEDRLTCSGARCGIEPFSVEPRTATVTAHGDPEAVTVGLPAIIAFRPQAAVVAGLASLADEGVKPEHVEELLRLGGGEAVAEEDRVVLLGWRPDEEPAERLECRPGVERQCLASAVGVLARRGRVVTVLARDPDEVIPGLPAALAQIGVSVRVRRHA